MDKENNKIVKTWMLVIQLGLVSISPIIICIALGFIIKSYLGEDYILLLALLGIFSGFYSAWRMAGHYAGEDDEQTRLVSGIYDKEKSEVEEDSLEDPLLEEFRRNNEEREKLM